MIILITILNYYQQAGPLPAAQLSLSQNSQTSLSDEKLLPMRPSKLSDGNYTLIDEKVLTGPAKTYRNKQEIRPK